MFTGAFSPRSPAWSCGGAVSGEETGSFVPCHAAGSSCLSFSVLAKPLVPPAFPACFLSILWFLWPFLLVPCPASGSSSLSYLFVALSLVSPAFPVQSLSIPGSSSLFCSFLVQPLVPPAFPACYLSSTWFLLPFLYIICPYPGSSQDYQPWPWHWRNCG